MEWTMEFTILYILWLLLAGYLLVGVPSYLADKTVKMLYPSLPAEFRLFPWWHRVVYYGLWGMLIVPLVLLLPHLGVDLEHLQIPKVPWVPESLYWMYRNIVRLFPIAVATFIARLATVVLFAWILQKKKGLCCDGGQWAPRVDEASKSVVDDSGSSSKSGPEEGRGQ